jgi:hypothetical protein
MLREEGSLEAHRTLAVPALERTLGVATAHERIFDVATELEPSVILLRSPHETNLDERALARLVSRGAKLLYWEGDAWGGGKPYTGASQAAARRADFIFTVSLGKQSLLMRKAGARAAIFYIPSCFCQVTFPHELVFPRVERASGRGVVHIGNNVTKLGIFPAMPGALGRHRMVRKLAAAPNLNFDVFGSGWRRQSAQGPTRFEGQVDLLRKYEVSVNWDHFPRYPMFFSNRLPVALLAGRHHVTTRHPGSDWLPGFDHGLWQVDTPREAVEVVMWLCEGHGGDRESAKRGRLWSWKTLSQANAVRFMLSKASRNVLAPKSAPWSLGLKA